MVLIPISAHFWCTCFFRTILKFSQLHCSSYKLPNCKVKRESRVGFSMANSSREEVVNFAPGPAAIPTEVCLLIQSVNASANLAEK